jgi:two-component system, chemotaxis family, protein-glutamate methylesterase/glutaminase
VIPVGHAGPVVVVGASAGGVEALKLLVAGLPADFPAAVLIVLHLAPGGPSVLPQILARECVLPVVVAEDGAALRAATVYVGPPNQHLELVGNTVRLSSGPPQDHHRPSVDRLFSTASAAAGSRVVGVVLSGALDDGAEGLAEIRAAGGTAVVQDPDTADYPDMPSNALSAVPDALRLPLADLAAELVRLCGGTAVVPRLT